MTRDVAIDDVEDGVAGHERGGVAVRAEAEVDEVELLGQGFRVEGRGRVEILGPDRHRPDVRGAAGREAALELREVAVRIAVGRDALVDLEDRDLLPRHAPVEALRTSPTASGRPTRRT